MPSKLSLSSLRKQLGDVARTHLFFPLSMWLLSRITVAIALLLIAPLLSAPNGGVQAEFSWGAFSAWDSNFYETIATQGYEILNGQKPGANVAFFPLFPLVISLFNNLGIPVTIAGVIINHLALLGALVLLYNWVESQNGTLSAKWVTALLAWCPLSLFGSVVYSEGLFLLFSTAALRSFDHQRFWWSALWGSFATASRVTGLALIPAFCLTAYQRKFSLSAYLASLLSSLGVIAYMTYCWLTYHDHLAFITVQHSFWNRSQGFDGMGWLRMFIEIMAGGKNWNAGQIKDWTHPLIFIIICLLASGLYKVRKSIGKKHLDYSYFFLLLLLWLLSGDPFLNTIAVFGSLYLLWKFKQEMSLVAVNYGFCGLSLLLISGGTISLSRLVYGIIPTSMALGLLLTHQPRWGYCLIGFFGILLVLMSIRFSQQLWVA